MKPPPLLFDRSAVKRNRTRAARHLQDHDFLYAEVAERLVERLEEINRSFGCALDLGTIWPGLAARLPAKHVIRAPNAFGAGGDLVADEEALPFAPQSFDLVVSLGVFHWTNDLPGALLECRRILRPDGLFLAAFPGGETLRDLKAAFLAAEVERMSGASPHVPPFADVRDLGGLLQRAGFALPVADVDRLTVSWGDPIALMRDLVGMGEASALAARRKGLTSPRLLARVAERYVEHAADGEGRVSAQFDIVFLTGWAPAPDQPTAKRRGSGKVSLAKVLGKKLD